MKTKKKLALSKETLRGLATSQLERAAGGIPVYSDRLGQATCNTACGVYSCAFACG